MREILIQIAGIALLVKIADYFKVPVTYFIED